MSLTHDYRPPTTDLESHEQTYRGFVWGVGLSAGLTLLTLVLLALLVL